MEDGGGRSSGANGAIYTLMEAAGAASLGESMALLNNSASFPREAQLSQMVILFDDSGAFHWDKRTTKASIFMVHSSHLHPRIGAPAGVMRSARG